MHAPRGAVWTGQHADQLCKGYPKFPTHPSGQRGPTMSAPIGSGSKQHPDMNCSSATCHHVVVHHAATRTDTAPLPQTPLATPTSNKNIKVWHHATPPNRAIGVAIRRCMPTFVFSPVSTCCSSCTKSVLVLPRARASQFEYCMRSQSPHLSCHASRQRACCMPHDLPTGATHAANDVRRS